MPDCDEDERVSGERRDFCRTVYEGSSGDGFEEKHPGEYERATLGERVSSRSHQGLKWKERLCENTTVASD